MKAIVIGNCQSVTFRNLAQRMVPGITFDQFQATPQTDDFDARIAGYDLAFVQPPIPEKLSPETFTQTRVIPFPRCNFAGLHPDLMYLNHKGENAVTILSHHSAIILGAWLHGLSLSETCGLFTPDTFTALRFLDYFDGTKKALEKEWEACGVDVRPHFSSWMAEGEPFMLTMNHPYLKVMRACTEDILAASGLDPLRDIEMPHHHLEDLNQFSVYPGYGEMIGIRSAPLSTAVWRGHKVPVSLTDWVADSFKRYEQYDVAAIAPNRAHNPTYTAFFEDFKRARHRRPYRANNPYSGIEPHQNWRKSVANTPVAEVDPVVACAFKIGRQDKVTTAGSCFAQHLARALQASGLTYHVAEKGDPAKGYGLFSARYGNIYTAAQLDQLIDRATGAFTPLDTVWRRSDGREIDPFRPEVTLETGVEADRAVHLRAVRQMIEEADYFVFTLGLTEAWRSRRDGAVFPIAPGVAGGEMDPERYEFVNFDADQTYASLASAIGKMRALNPNLRILLTVSPVPLMATFENRHVLVSTTYSKAVLRVAAERACATLDKVYYFPSFEIITGNFNRGAYFEEDLRGVRPEGVQHVMRLFLKHAVAEEARDSHMEQEIRDGMAVLCAEELLDDRS